MGSDNKIGLVALFAFLIGGAVGAGVALLMAPQSGKKTRKQIREFVDNVKEQAYEHAHGLKKKVFEN